MNKESIEKYLRKSLPQYLAYLDYLFILRPTLFFPIWTILLAGYGTGYFFNDHLIYWEWSINFVFVLQFIFVTLLWGAVAIFNQLNDISSDKHNRKLFLLSDKHISSEFASRYAYILAAIAVLGEVIIDIKVAFLFVVFLLIWGYLYNYPPFRWKDKPLPGVLTNIIGGALCYFIGWGMFGDLQWQTLWKVIPYLLAFGAVSLLTTIPDMDGDKSEGKTTFPIKYGINRTVRIASVWVVLALFTGIKTGDPVIAIPSLLSLPLYIIMVFKPTPVWILRCIRYPILFISLTVCVMFPWYFILVVIIFYLSRIYYKYRFSLDYPTFKVYQSEGTSL